MPSNRVLAAIASHPNVAERQELLESQAALTKEVVESQAAEIRRLQQERQRDYASVALLVDLVRENCSPALKDRILNRWLNHTVVPSTQRLLPLTAQQIVAERDRLRTKINEQARRIQELEVLREHEAGTMVAALEARKDWEKACYDPSEVAIPLHLADCSAHERAGVELDLDEALGDGRMSSLLHFFAGILTGGPVRFLEHNEND